jgi:glycosyltransferase involved in cell wall biosynthesis
MEKRISAIITVFNKKDTIELTVESLLKQGGISELCIVDDGSTDGSVQRIELLARNNKNIKFISQNNQGIAKSLNVGLLNTDGEYIIVLDADVILPEGWLAKLLPKFSEKDVASASGLTKLGNKKNIWAAFGGLSVEYRQAKIGNDFVDHLSTCNTIYRREAFDRSRKRYAFFSKKSPSKTKIPCFPHI